MQKGLYILLVLSALATAARAQTAQIIKISQLEKIIHSNTDTTYVINFWATWCVPCVKEFPAFQALAQKHQHEKVKVVMVSLDFKKGYEQTLVPFLQKHAIAGTVLLLDEPDYNSWINKISTNWQGEIPVTIMVNNAKKIHTFFGHDFTPESLEQSFINTITQQQ
jgi:thiol-disulfide isomerase/thioredoxin